MGSLGRIRRQCLALAILALLLPWHSMPRAQGLQSSGTDLMDIFRTMSSDQQQQILGRMGLGGASGQGASGQSQRSATDAELETQRLRQQRAQQDQQQSRFPIFRADDWVVVEVDTRPLPPRPTDTNSIYQSLAAGTGMVGSSALSPQLALNPQLQALQPQLSPQLQAQLLAQSQPQQLPQATQQTGSPVLALPSGPLSEAQQNRIGQLVQLVRSKNPYQLTHEGFLILPGFNPIALAGLTELQATLRLEVEPALTGMHFRITRLPLAKAGVEGLKPFGYDLFERAPSTFAPDTNVPVPADYVIGPGDQLEIQLYGSQNRNFELTVGRDGRISFPELGPLSVAGQRFNSVKESIEAQVARQMIGVKASVSMADTRAIRVFVLGELQDPGSYTVSGLATVTSALYAAGGVKSIGSLRDIQLKRQGVIARHMDLYDLLLHGNTNDDAKLLPGDVIFIPPVGATVSIDGEVHRPAIYEIRNETTVADLVALAGGLTPDAEPGNVTLTRIDEHQQRIVMEVDLGTAAGRSRALRNGDVLRINRVRPTLESGIVLQGHVFTPGAFAYRSGMRLADVIHSVQELKPNADLHYVLIRRELPPDRRVIAFSTDLGAALASPEATANIALMPRDRITVFDLESGRDRIIEPLLDELRLESRMDKPADIVRIEGQVKVPGEYPLEPAMHVSDLLRAGGSLADAAYGGKAELTRYTVVNGEERRTTLIPIDLMAVLRGDPQANIALEPFDLLSVKEISLWGEQEQVTLVGQVRFPGTYTIKQGETLKSVLLRAGGLTEFAFAEGSVFTREELRRREQEQLDMLTERTQSDLTSMALQGVAAGALGGAGGAGGGGAGATAMQVGQTLLSQLRSTRAIGRLVIDIPRLLGEREGSQDDVVLRGGDRLIVPRYQQEVTVIGEVQSATSHLYRQELERDDYINLSGGVTRRADVSKIYVVRANGSVVASHSHLFRVGSHGVQIRPGDTIVVPLNTEKLPPLLYWQAITGIIYNLAIGAAAVHSLGL